MQILLMMWMLIIIFKVQQWKWANFSSVSCVCICLCVAVLLCSWRQLRPACSSSSSKRGIKKFCPYSLRSTFTSTRSCTESVHVLFYLLLYPLKVEIQIGMWPVCWGPTAVMSRSRRRLGRRWDVITASQRYSRIAYFWTFSFFFIPFLFIASIIFNFYRIFLTVICSLACCIVMIK